MHIFLQILSIYCFTQAVIAVSPKSQLGLKSHNIRKRYVNPMPSSYQTATPSAEYTSSYQTETPTTGYTSSYQTGTPPTSYPSYQGAPASQYSSQLQLGCDCTQNCYFSTKPCTKTDYPTGCTLQDCTADDTELIGYTCFCTSTFFPGGCVYPYDGTQRCVDAATNLCSCNGISQSPDDCSMDVCDHGEKPTCTTRCICHPTDYTRQPCGCVTTTISTVDTTLQSTNAVTSNFLNSIQSTSSFPSSNRILAGKGNSINSGHSKSVGSLSTGSKNVQAELLALEALLNH
ncbi:LIM domain-binding protein 3 [Orchesella cincta]|uniref:LIM domain-binding protein 3 n=1 Tax=Orchesella cincta TaxID=48709 RepID=A0A1D2MLP6_ORCCI|nr:LIM domain-binding protein 3 [Orchesella cincta]